MNFLAHEILTYSLNKPTSAPAETDLTHCVKSISTQVQKMKPNPYITLMSPAKSNKCFVIKPSPHSFGHTTSIAAIQHSEKEQFSFPMSTDEWRLYLLSWKGYTGLYSGRKTQMRNACLSWKRMQACMKGKPWVCIGLLLTDQSERSIQNWTIRKNTHQKNQTPTPKYPKLYFFLLPQADFHMCTYHVHI